MVNNPNKKVSLECIDIAIGCSVVLCLLVCHLASLLGVGIQALAACTGAVMCVQDSKNASWGAGLNRLKGVICGGLIGVAVVLIDNAVNSDVVFYLLVGAGIVFNLLLCKAVKLPFVQARVSCMSLLLVTLVLQNSARINYALGRLIGTVVGACVALLVSMVFATLMKKKDRV